jgi:putative N6-adenine-specific DNA methylase
MANIELIATTLLGVESITGKELKRLKFDNIKVEDGKVTFSGDESAIPRANLWLRTAERVLLKLGEFEATSFEELFEKTKALPWDEWIPESGAFPVKGYSLKSKLHSVPDCQSIIKKAVVEKLKSKYKKDWFDEKGPTYHIHFSIFKDRATLMIDTSGEGLHKRGYRAISNEAPLRETLAAALVLLSDWRYDRPLLDPFCGSGTIPIEACLIGLNLAPGINREFAAEKWPNFTKKIWWDARRDAHATAKYDIKLNITGSDIDPKAVKLASENACKAGIEDYISFKNMSMKSINPTDGYGCIICNPPYGERMGEMKEVESLYAEMGRIFRKLGTWSYYIITSHPDFERLFGKKANKNRKLYNGMIKCYYYQFYGPRPPRLQSS